MIESPPEFGAHGIAGLPQVVKRANQSQFGLAAGIWAKDIDVVNTVTRGLHAGTVWVNCCAHPPPHAISVGLDNVSCLDP